MKEQKRGLNIIGYTEGEFGLGEAVRLNIEAAKTHQIPLNLINFEKLKKYPKYTYNFEYDVSLVQISLRDIDTFFRVMDPKLFKARYTILFLIWESEYLPPELSENLSLFNEIWTASSYCKELFKKVYANPILIVPHPVEITLKSIYDQKAKVYFDKQKFSFLFIFSYHSSVERKNPFFLVEAFNKAFKTNENVELIIKTVGEERHRKESNKLHQQVAASKNIKIFNVDLDKNAVNHLINDCDCYVSMHHSEGYGLTLAEAMFFGKPTIATNYSGNKQFMNHLNSFLIDFDIAPIENPDTNFSSQTIWANPNLENAVETLRDVYFNSDLRDTKAMEAKTYIKNELSFHAVGSIIKNQVDFLFDNFEDLITNQKAYLINQLQYTKAENAYLKRQIRRMKKNLLIRFILFLKNKTRIIKNRLKK